MFKSGLDWSYDLQRVNLNVYNLAQYMLYVRVLLLCSADVNECLLNPSPCEMSCQNLEGGYACGCPAGYLLNPDNTTCRDLDECTTGQHVCQQLCINTHGSYKCGCQPGYRQTGDHCAGTTILIIIQPVVIFVCTTTHLCTTKCQKCTCHLRFYIDHDVCNR